VVHLLLFGTFSLVEATFIAILDYVWTVLQAMFDNGLGLQSRKVFIACWASNLTPGVLHGGSTLPRYMPLEVCPLLIRGHKCPACIAAEWAFSSFLHLFNVFLHMLSNVGVIVRFESHVADGTGPHPLQYFVS
jgi:hypothetical protein